MKIFEVVYNPDEPYDPKNPWDPYTDPFIDDEDNKRWDLKNTKRIMDAWGEVSGFVSGGGGITPKLDQAVQILIDAFGNRVTYTGDMYRAFGIAAEEMVTPDIRLMSSKLHKWAIESARQTVSWTTDLGVTVTHLSGQPTVILHQNSTGLDIIKLNIWEYSESEILSPYSNNVSIYGFAVNEKFFPVEDFKEFVKYSRSIDLSQFY